jgi:hypothetical protein
VASACPVRPAASISLDDDKNLTVARAPPLPQTGATHELGQDCALGAPSDASIDAAETARLRIEVRAARTAALADRQGLQTVDRLTNGKLIENDLALRPRSHVPAPSRLARAALLISQKVR